jgi:hypothetical protein
MAAAKAKGVLRQHTNALTFGWNEDGQLGIHPGAPSPTIAFLSFAEQKIDGDGRHPMDGKLPAFSSPMPINLPADFNLFQVAAGQKHSIFLTGVVCPH